MLKKTIEEDSNLSTEDKVEALEQIKIIAEARINLQDSTRYKMANRSIMILKGMTVDLPPNSKFVVASMELLPRITEALLSAT
ncbi:hypothetical protein [Iningainema tapete]|uniref:Uncharacterized protein n=1 Tax=Iningainema tapete BLCC-T55 TaxID=2748662 RepID=A0A8J6XGM5_9CYAN|nr:hypothetical protein [Iningainema tapete]MBD2776480.1 hypothetical protein [Iningainema tapete BLCC-T55]